jgi:hypothetical protein
MPPWGYSSGALVVAVFGKQVDLADDIDVVFGQHVGESDPRRKVRVVNGAVEPRGAYAACAHRRGNRVTAPQGQVRGQLVRREA